VALLVCSRHFFTIHTECVFAAATDVNELDEKRCCCRFAD